MMGYFHSLPLSASNSLTASQLPHLSLFLQAESLHHHLQQNLYNHLPRPHRYRLQPFRGYRRYELKSDL